LTQCQRVTDRWTDRQTDRQTDGFTLANTALCIASYADALSKLIGSDRQSGSDRRSESNPNPIPNPNPSRSEPINFSFNSFHSFRSPISTYNYLSRKRCKIGPWSWWLHWLSVGLVIERSQVQLPAGALSSQLGQFSLPSLRGR